MFLSPHQEIIQTLSWRLNPDGILGVDFYYLISFFNKKILTFQQLHYIIQYASFRKRL